jgi:hypothetical protein
MEVLCSLFNYQPAISIKLINEAIHNTRALIKSTTLDEAITMRDQLLASRMDSIISKVQPAEDIGHGKSKKH